MQLKVLTVGSLMTNCCIVWCDNTGKAALIDPGFDQQQEAEKISNLLTRNNLELECIVNSHGHPDHTCGNSVMKNLTGASLAIHHLDASLLGEKGEKLAALFGPNVVSPVADQLLSEGDTIDFGEVTLQVLHTPGHSPGSISLVGEKCVFTGDTLFAGSIGRVDLPGGSAKQIIQSIRSKLAVLPNSFRVYPGHGPESTIGSEKRNNPFLQPGFDISLLT